MPFAPNAYAEMLRKCKDANVTVWLINIWTGGVYGVGSRMKLKQEP
jgi:ATP-dependent phosphoenolpyruvate carboxykinase